MSTILERLQKVAEQNAGAIIFSTPVLTAGTTSAECTIQIPNGYRSIRAVYNDPTLTAKITVSKVGSATKILEARMDAMPDLGWLVSYPIDEGERNYRVLIEAKDGATLAGTVISFQISPRVPEVVGVVVGSEDIDAGTSSAQKNVQLQSGYKWLKAIYVPRKSGQLDVTEQGSGVKLISTLMKAMPAFGFVLNKTIGANLNFTTSVTSVASATVDDVCVSYHLEKPAS